MTGILEVALLVVSVLIIAIVLLQSNKASDAGQIITGGNEALFAQTKERGVINIKSNYITRSYLLCDIIYFICKFKKQTCFFLFDTFKLIFLD